jgi:peptidoglycan/LPS O-acetylase OafA/YrhL
MLALKRFISTMVSEVEIVPDLLKEKYLPSLDGLRAISVLLIVLTHTDIFNTQKLGVEIFFVISGFIITTLLLKEKIHKKSISLRKFYIRRFFRIMPVSVLYIIVILLLNISGYITPTITWFYFFCSFFPLANIFNNTWFFTHYWSLATEEQFYFLFPPILKRGMKSYLIFFAILFLLIIMARSFGTAITKEAYPDPHSVMHYMHYLIHAIKYFEGIMIGSLLSIFVFKGMIKLDLSGIYKIIVDILLIVSIAMLWKYEWIGAVFNHTLLLIAIALLILNNLKKGRDPFYYLLNSRLFRQIGLMSYSIYIWQQPFTKFIPWAGAFKGADSVLFNVSAMFVVASLSYYYWEKPFLKFKDKFAG